MGTPDPLKIKPGNPEDLIYVSKKNWARKVNIEDGDPTKSMFARPGPISGLVLVILDVVVEIVLKTVFYLWDITEYAFNWISNMIFGNFRGIIPQNYSGGTMITTKFFRYTMNVFLPPFGIMLSKGVYGWFSILCCMLITYVNYLAGIIFAFVVTAQNRYADQYESYQKKMFNTNAAKLPPQTDDTSAILGASIFIILIILVFCLFFTFF